MPHLHAEHGFEGFQVGRTRHIEGWGEQHITPDVALGFWEYQLATADQNFLREATWPVLEAVAEWIESRGVFTARGFEIQNIMGTDESVPNISNSSYMNLVCKMVMAAAVRAAQMAGLSGPESWSKVHGSLVLPIDKAKNIVLPYDNPPPTANPAYSLDQLDFLTIHDPPVSKELLKSTHSFEDTVRRQRLAASKSSQRDFSIGFAEAAEAATAALVGDKRGALELFHQSWKNVWLEPFGMIRETPSQDYGCFLTNFGSLLQTVMFGFTGPRISENDWQKYPASLPAGWSKIEIDRVYVKGQARRLVATDGSPAQFQTA